VVCKLFGAGDQVPLMPFVEEVGSVGKVLPAQIAATGEKVGVMLALTTISPLTFEVPFQNPPPVVL
jgi:hypothetical protein